MKICTGNKNYNENQNKFKNSIFILVNIQRDNLSTRTLSTKDTFQESEWNKDKFTQTQTESASHQQTLAEGNSRGCISDGRKMIPNGTTWDTRRNEEQRQ